MRAFMLPRDVALFLRSARTDARIDRLRSTLGSAGAMEAVYAADADPWASASPDYRYQSRKYEVLASLLPTGRYGRALDLGCGAGLLSRHLADHADEVLGVDVSATAIARARLRNADRPNTAFEVHDLLELPAAFDGLFDLVVIADVLYYLAPLDDDLLARIAARVARMLTPGGTCVLANHYLCRLDPESRRSLRIHDAFKASNGLLPRQDHRRPFYLVSVLVATGQGSATHG
jgi:SAM-dependent methyltransferase